MKLTTVARCAGFILAGVCIAAVATDAAYDNDYRSYIDNAGGAEIVFRQPTSGQANIVAAEGVMSTVPGYISRGDQRFPCARLVFEHTAMPAAPDEEQIAYVSQGGRVEIVTPRQSIDRNIECKIG
ncbi:MAG: hypothetical protein GC136_09285 [Alphaproteobacteria bacterium]|nr:hypothetical protein [Alphaproteobacteria bacterium]